jgi:hypothetical protein
MTRRNLELVLNGGKRGGKVPISGEIMMYSMEQKVGREEVSIIGHIFIDME